MIIKCEESIREHIEMSNGKKYIRYGFQCWLEDFDTFTYEVWDHSKLTKLEGMYNTYKSR